MHEPVNVRVKWPYLILGFRLAIAIAALVGGGFSFNAATLASLTRWLHIVFGVFWIGLLYYFNAVQTPAMAAAAADKGVTPAAPGINIYVAPRALLWSQSAGPRSAPGSWRRIRCCRKPMARFINTLAFRLLEQFSRVPLNVIMGFGAWFGTIMPAVQRLGAHMAQPKEDFGDRARHRR